MTEEKLTPNAKRIFDFFVNKNDKLEIENDVEITLRHKNSGCFDPFCGHLGIGLHRVKGVCFQRHNKKIEIISFIEISLEMIKLQASIGKYPPATMSSCCLNFEEDSLDSPSEYQTGIWIDIIKGIFQGFSLVIYAY